MHLHLQKTWALSQGQLVWVSSSSIFRHNQLKPSTSRHNFLDAPQYSWLKQPVLLLLLQSPRHWTSIAATTCPTVSNLSTSWTTRTQLTRLTGESNHLPRFSQTPPGCRRQESSRLVDLRTQLLMCLNVRHHIRHLTHSLLVCALDYFVPQALHLLGLAHVTAYSQQFALNLYKIVCCKKKR
jgi:hypothetical protein